MSSRSRSATQKATYVMVMPSHGEHSEQVHAEAHRAHEQQLIRVHFRRLQSVQQHEFQHHIQIAVDVHLQPLDRLENDENGYQQQEDTVCKARERFDSPVPA